MTIELKIEEELKTIASRFGLVAKDKPGEAYT
jgi:hypothetical protein